MYSCWTERNVERIGYSLIQLKDENMLLSYDTAFCLGEFYFSPLLFKRVIFDKLPVMPVLFLISERKLKEVHETLFKIFTSYVKRTTDIPIVVDMEVLNLAIWHMMVQKAFQPICPDF